MRQERREPWKLPYSQRSKTSKKFRDTEKKIKQPENDHEWYSAAKLKYLLRKCWWGIKRYKK